MTSVTTTFETTKLIVAKLDKPAEFIVLYTRSDGHVQFLHFLHNSVSMELHFGLYPQILESVLLTDFPDAIPVMECFSRAAFAD